MSIALNFIFRFLAASCAYGYLVCLVLRKDHSLTYHIPVPSDCAHICALITTEKCNKIYSRRSAVSASENFNYLHRTKKNPNWGLTHPTTSEFLTDIFKLDNQINSITITTISVQTVRFGTVPRSGNLYFFFTN